MLHVPFLLLVNETFKPINPFSGIYTGVSFPNIPAILNAAHRNNKDLPLEVFSLPFNCSPKQFIGALEFAVKLKKSTFWFIYIS